METNWSCPWQKYITQDFIQYGVENGSTHFFCNFYNTLIANTLFPKCKRQDIIVNERYRNEDKRLIHYAIFVFKCIHTQNNQLIHLISHSVYILHSL